MALFWPTLYPFWTLVVYPLATSDALRVATRFRLPTLTRRLQIRKTSTIVNFPYSTTKTLGASLPLLSWCLRMSAPTQASRIALFLALSILSLATCLLCCHPPTCDLASDSQSLSLLLLSTVRATMSFAIPSGVFPRIPLALHSTAPCLRLLRLLRYPHRTCCTSRALRRPNTWPLPR